MNPITYYEIYRGLVLIESKKKLDLFESLCQEIRIINFSIKTLKLAAEIYAQLRKIRINC